MNAYEIPDLRFSLPAGGAIARFRFISVGANSTAVQATATTPVIGVSMNAVVTNAGVTAAQQIAEIATGLIQVEAGGVVAVGVRVVSNADGKAIALTNEPFAAGVAITNAAAAGDLITVKIA
jgi:hypothetical protein